jgi:hypothetical protein
MSACPVGFEIFHFRRPFFELIDVLELCFSALVFVVSYVWSGSSNATGVRRTTATELCSPNGLRASAEQRLLPLVGGVVAGFVRRRERRKSRRTFGVARFAAIGLFAVVSLLQLQSAWRDPDWNFDAVPYLNAALSWTVHDPAERHHQVYTALFGAVPREALYALTQVSAYRKTLAASPAALETQIAISINRPAYVVLIAALHALGMNGILAIRFISCIAYGLLCAMVLAWMISARAPAWAIIAASVVVSSPPLPELASLCTPDLIATVPLVSGAWLLLARGRATAGVIVASTATLLRPDVGIVAQLMTLWAMSFGPAKLPVVRGVTVIIVVALLGLFLPPLMGGASLRTLLRFYFESRLYETARIHETIDFAGYMTALIANLSGAGLYRPSTMPHYFLLALIGAVVLWRERKPVVALIAWIWLYVPVHYLLYPDRSDRYFVGVYTVTALAILQALASLEQAAEVQRETAEARADVDAATARRSDPSRAPTMITP